MRRPARRADDVVLPVVGRALLGLGRAGRRLDDAVLPSGQDARSRVVLVLTTVLVLGAVGSGAAALGERPVVGAVERVELGPLAVQELQDWASGLEDPPPTAGRAVALAVWEPPVRPGAAADAVAAAGVDVEVLRTVVMDGGAAVEVRLAPQEAVDVVGCDACVRAVVLRAPPSALLSVASASGVLGVEAAPVGLPPGRVVVRTDGLSR